MNIKSVHEQFMQRCIELASLATGNTSPNPLVGAVIVYKDKIIGEGYHHQAGLPHAEVEAIKSVKQEDMKLLSKSCLYVSLEPCCHYGKTPPCTDLILQHQIPEVVIGIKDSNEKVSGKGIEKLKTAGVKVTTSILEQECKALNKYFFTTFEKKRPYIILKWAQTSNGFFAPVNHTQKWITSAKANTITHYWRSQTDAILIGTKTALNDNPALNVRHLNGKNPLRIIIDQNLQLPLHLNIFNGSQPTLIINAIKTAEKENLKYVQTDFNEDFFVRLFEILLAENIQSIIIEGGAFTINKFIEKNLWDEARVWTSFSEWETGIKAPVIESSGKQEIKTEHEILTVYTNRESK